MNKVININISGMVFHIDEEAFEVLNRYLESLKRHFKNTEGGDEIMADIEARIAEMLTENLKSRSEVVSMANVQLVIASMGQPEDMQDTEAEPNTNTGSYSKYRAHYNFNPGKRVYRDPDHKVIAGVCSGISEYLGLDPVWLRLIFAVAILGFGTGLLAYLVLWAILPVAETPSEKLEMRGERVNISNIEKTVKENLESIRDRIDHEFKHFDTKSFENRFHNFFNGLFEGVSTAFGGVFYVIARLLSLFLILISASVMIGVICIILGAIGIFSFTVPASFYDFFDNHQQSVIVITLFAFVVALPFIGMFIRALRYLSGYRRRSRALSAVFGSLWSVAFVALIVMIFGNISNYSKSDSYDLTDQIKKPTHDTLYLSVNDNGKGLHNYHDYGDMELNEIWRHVKSPSAHNGFGMVDLDITRANDKNISLVKQFYSRGKSMNEAHDLAQSIQYGYVQQDSSITFDEGFKIAKEAAWRGQNVSMELRIPVGTVIIMNPGMEHIIYDIDNTNNTYDADMIGYKWKMTTAGLTCLDCPSEDDMPHRHRHRHHWRVGRNFDAIL